LVSLTSAPDGPRVATPTCLRRGSPPSGENPAPKRDWRRHQNLRVAARARRQHRALHIADGWRAQRYGRVRSQGLDLVRADLLGGSRRETPPCSATSRPWRTALRSNSPERKLSATLMLRRSAFFSGSSAEQATILWRRISSRGLIGVAGPRAFAEATSRWPRPAFAPLALAVAGRDAEPCRSRGLAEPATPSLDRDRAGTSSRAEVCPVRAWLAPALPKTRAGCRQFSAPSSARHAVTGCAVRSVTLPAPASLPRPQDRDTLSAQNAITSANTCG